METSTILGIISMLLSTGLAVKLYADSDCRMHCGSSIEAEPDTILATTHVDPEVASVPYPIDDPVNPVNPVPIHIPKKKRNSLRQHSKE